VEVPLDAGLFAVDFEGVEGFMTPGIAGGFEKAQRPVAKATEEDAGVVDADLLHLPGELVFAFLDERLGGCVDGVDVAIEPDRGVDAVGEKIAGDS